MNTNEKYPCFKWIAESNDESYQNFSHPFNTERECYEDMRQSVLNKMLWNTEWEDVTDMTDMEVLDYKVDFNAKFIKHTSYSGTYLYKVVPCGKGGELEPMAWYELEDELGIKPKRRTTEEIKNFVEDFVHGRYTNNELEEKLSTFLGKKVELEDCTDASYNYCDYQLTCQVYTEDDGGDTCVDLDLWYLPTRYGQMYITETNVEAY